MKFLVLFPFLICLLAAKAQNSNSPKIDSLEQKLSTVRNYAEKIKVLGSLIDYYQNTDNKKALTLEAAGLALAQRAKIDSEICTFYAYMGESSFYIGDYRKGIYYLNSDYNIAEKSGYKKLMTIALADLGMGYQMQSDFSRSQEFYFKSLKIAEGSKNNTLVALCYLGIGSNYNSQNNYDKAIFYANKILKINSQVKKYVLQTKALELLGSAYEGENTFSKAREYFLQALKIYQEHHNDYGIGTIYYSLATSYQSRDYEKQLEYGLKGQEVWDRVAPKGSYAINNLGHIGGVYGALAENKKLTTVSRNNLLDKAETYLSKAIEIAGETNAKQSIMDFSDNLAYIDSLKGKYKEAYKNLRIRNNLNDSIYSQENKNKIASLEGKHEIELRDKQLLINKLEITDQHKQRLFLIIGLGTLLIIAGLIYYQNIQRKRTNTTLLHLNSELDEANKVKTRFFSILNHDLRSPVASFVNFLHLQREAPDLMDAAAQAAYSKKATAAAENLLNTMEDLLLWSKGQMENFKPNAREIPVSLLYDYLKQAIPGNENISISFEQQPDMKLNIDEHYIKTIMYNLTNNAVKALGNITGGSITWKAWEEGGQKYLSITDNGPGATEEAFRALYDDSAPVGIKTGLGLHIIRDLAKAIGCKISVSTMPGSGAEFKLMFS